MIEKTIQVFTEKEEEFIGLLSSIGTRKNIAKVLVCLSRVKRITSRDIESGADLRQPEVSIALKYLAERGWAESHEFPSPNKGRPVKIWTLTLPLGKILDTIGLEKQHELASRLAAVQKVRMFA